MRVIIKGMADEISDKRHALLKRLAGDDYDIVKAEKEPKRKESKFRAQREMIEYWNGKFKETLDAIKKDIESVIEA